MRCVSACIYLIRAQSAGYSAMEDAVMDRTFRVKEVAVFGRPVPVILQDTNGPCPLLSIGEALGPPLHPAHQESV